MSSPFWEEARDGPEWTEGHHAVVKVSFRSVDRSGGRPVCLGEVEVEGETTSDDVCLDS